MLEVLRNTLLFFLLMVILHFILDTITEDSHPTYKRPTSSHNTQIANVHTNNEKQIAVHEENQEKHMVVHEEEQVVLHTTQNEEEEEKAVHHTTTTILDNNNSLSTMLIENDPVAKELYDYVYDDNNASENLSQMYVSLNKNQVEGDALSSELRVDEHWKKMSAEGASKPSLLTTSFEVIGNINDFLNDDIAGFDLSGGWETMYELI